jgi:uncharacterized membrane protein YgcG
MPQKETPAVRPGRRSFSRVLLSRTAWRFSMSRRTTAAIFGLGFLLLGAGAFNVAEAQTTTGIVISQNHHLNDKGTDILLLQQFLNAHGFNIALSGAGSPGHETNFFGTLTYNALTKFQASTGLPSTGFLGPLTRDLIVSLTSNVNTSISTASASTTNQAASSTNNQNYANFFAPPPTTSPSSEISISYPQTSGGGGGSVSSGGGSVSSGGGSVSSGGGSVSAPVSPGASCSISASPSTIADASSTTLTWSSTNAISALLSSVGGVAISGSRSISLSSTSTMAYGYTIILTVADSVGANATCTTTVTILPDTTPPSVSVITASSTVWGPYVTVRATATDNIGVAQVAFEVDGDTIGVATSTPYSINWDSTSVAAGPHTLSAVAEDTSGNYTTSSMAVTVSSSPPPFNAVFAATSFWYTPIPANAPLNVNSAGMDTNFLAQITKYFGDVNVAWSPPIYTLSGGVQTYAVSNSSGAPSLNAGLAAQQSAVPLIPNVTIAAPNPPDTDQGMIIYQPSSDSMWDFWEFTQTAPPYQTGWGGGMTGVSESNGIWSYPYGESATGLPYINAVITIADMNAGQINHVLGIALPETDYSSKISWPANRSDGTGTTLSGTAIPEGTRFRLDPTLDLSSYNLSPIALMVAKAAQIYGFVVMDKSGGITIWAQHPMSFTQMGQPDPWPQFMGAYESARYTILNNFPWNHLQFMPTNYGE